jgi:hypothetical protein
MSTFAAAHIVVDAVALGVGEIVVMTRADETDAAYEIERFGLDTDCPLTALYRRGWHADGVVPAVGSGYSVVNVVRD